MFVESVLAKKGRNVLTISPDAMVFEAIVAMEEGNVGALLVMDGRRIVGIITERDYARKVILKGKASKETPVGEVMTTRVCVVDKKKKLNECMAIMTAKRLRHLPVLEDGELIGLVSIGDVVKNIIAEQDHDIDNLFDYIHGIYKRSPKTPQLKSG